VKSDGKKIEDLPNLKEKEKTCCKPHRMGTCCVAHFIARRSVTKTDQYSKKFQLAS
jgi:hypothetical protein